MLFNYLRVGKIVNTQGIKGEVRVIPLTDNVDRFNNLKYVYFDDEKLIPMDIDYVKYHKNFVLIKFIGINGIDEAEKLKNTYILVDREHAVPLPEGSYFLADFIGIDVYDINNNYIGKVTDVINTGSNDVYLVKNNENELLLPALKSVVHQVNMDDMKMIVEIPEGLV